MEFSKNLCVIVIYLVLYLDIIKARSRSHNSYDNSGRGNCIHRGDCEWIWLLLPLGCVAGFFCLYFLFRVLCSKDEEGAFFRNPSGNNFVAEVEELPKIKSPQNEELQTNS